VTPPFSDGSPLRRNGDEARFVEPTRDQQRKSTMKPFFAAALAGLAMAVAVPALAQDWDHRRDEDRPSSWDIDRREQWLDERIERGRADGSLDKKEAHKVHDKLRDIRQLEGRMRKRDGGYLNDADRGVLEDKLDDLSRQIHWMRENNERAPWER
jgi:hypothetical protein